VPGLQQLAAQAGAYLLVACAEAAAEGAAGAEGASKGLEGLGLAGAAAQQVRLEAERLELGVVLQLMGCFVAAVGYRVCFSAACCVAGRCVCMGDSVVRDLCC
jgi:hypothetical protein